MPWIIRTTGQYVTPDPVIDIPIIKDGNEATVQ